MRSVFIMDKRIRFVQVRRQSVYNKVERFCEAIFSLHTRAHPRKKTKSYDISPLLFAEDSGVIGFFMPNCSNFLITLYFYMTHCSKIHTPFSRNTYILFRRIREINTICNQISSNPFIWHFKFQIISSSFIS